MYEDYCFKCGSHVLIDETTKLCGPCYRDWLEARARTRP